jgi:hypothetical protein
VEANFEFIVDDISQVDADGRLYITATLTSTCTEADASDNTLTIVATTSAICISTDVAIGAQTFNTSAKKGVITIG